MRIWDKLFGKNKEPQFTKVEEEIRSLENQDGRIDNPTKQDLTAYLQTLFEQDDQFVTFTLAKAQNGIRYMQACIVNGEAVVQLGLEDGDSTRLVEKPFPDYNACAQAFLKFFDFGLVENIDSYKPVEFLK